ncbi:hypothetical protein Tco_1126056 [Tanacetum coccineum]
MKIPVHHVYTIIESFKARVVEGFSVRVGDLTDYDADQMWKSLSHIIEDAAMPLVWIAGQQDPGRPAGNLGGLVMLELPRQQTLYAEHGIDNA